MMNPTSTAGLTGLPVSTYDDEPVERDVLEAAPAVIPVGYALPGASSRTLPRGAVDPMLLWKAGPTTPFTLRRIVAAVAAVGGLSYLALNPPF